MIIGPRPAGLWPRGRALGGRSGAGALASTLAFLCGFIVGSLQKLWPWRQTLSYYLDSRGDAIPVNVKPIAPAQFEALYGEDPMVLSAIVACSMGLALVMVLDVVSRLGARET